MLGYVTCEKPELKMREFELYSGYYCGVCKSIGRRYGQLPRMVLSYDAAFLALVLAGVQKGSEQISLEHCMIHPIKKKTIVRNEAIDYAADVMLLLAWFKLMDDAQDEGKVYAKAGVKLVQRTYKKIIRKHPKLAEKIKENLAELNGLEKENCSSIDRVAEPFARVMADIFVMDTHHSPEEERLLAALGYHLGKWIYLMDAWEDIEDNIKTGAYNPLIYRYQYNKTTETQENFRKRIYNDCQRNLLIYLSELSKIVDLLEFNQNKDIIENIVCMGLLRRTEKALEEKEEKKHDGKSL
ncbi:MAG: DUF5685 family protein [Anaerovoracaceae bacterium]